MNEMSVTLTGYYLAPLNISNISQNPKYQVVELDTRENHRNLKVILLDFCAEN